MTKTHIFIKIYIYSIYKDKIKINKKKGEKCESCGKSSFKKIQNWRFFLWKNENNKKFLQIL